MISGIYCFNGNFLWFTVSVQYRLKKNQFPQVKCDTETVGDVLWSTSVEGEGSVLEVRSKGRRAFWLGLCDRRPLTCAGVSHLCRVGLQNGDCRASLYLFCPDKTAADIYIHPVCLLFIYFLTHQLLNTPLAE